MAVSPRMTVRLAPSIVHALEYIAEREQVSPAEMARTLLGAAVQAHIAKHGWERDCQARYMPWLEQRAARDRSAAERDDSADDIDVAGEPALATATRPVESARPYGRTDDQFPRMGGTRSSAGSGLIGQAEADRLVATMRPDGRKRRT